MFPQGRSIIYSVEKIGPVHIGKLRETVLIIYNAFFLPGQVEFIEEVQDGEIPVMTFQTPYDSDDGTIDTVGISRSINVCIQL